LRPVKEKYKPYYQKALDKHRTELEDIEQEMRARPQIEFEKPPPVIVGLKNAEIKGLIPKKK